MINRLDISEIFYAVPVTSPVTLPMTREAAHIKFNTGYKENGYTIDLSLENVYQDCHHHNDLIVNDVITLSMVGEVSVKSTMNYPEKEIVLCIMELVIPI